MTWQTVDVPCAEVPEIYFADDPTDNNHTYNEPLAKRICSECPLKTQCLEHAMREEGSAGPRARWGIRGGLTPGERFRLYRNTIYRGRQN